MTVKIDGIEYDEDHLLPQNTAREFGVQIVTRLTNGNLAAGTRLSLDRHEARLAYHSTGGWSYHDVGDDGEILVCRHGHVLVHFRSDQWNKFCSLLTHMIDETVLDDMEASLENTT